MREVVNPIDRNADESVQLFDSLSRLLVVGLFMGLDRFDDLAADGVHGIQGIHRTLEDQGDLLPPNCVQQRVILPKAAVIQARDREEISLLVRRLQAGHRFIQSPFHFSFSGLGTRREFGDLPT